MRILKMLACYLLAVLFSLTIIAPAAARTESVNPDIVRVDFVHFKKAKAAPEGKNASGYKLLGYKWADLPISYAINPNGPVTVQESTVAAITAAATTWDEATYRDLFNPPAIVSGAAYGVYDQQNSIEFGEITDSNTIAVTSIWFNKRTKTIVETDMKFNTYYTWGNAAENPSVMDIQNIATHEFGHVCGLDDLYTAVNADKTMYGYSGYGETEKRSLETEDIAGLQKIYGR